ncbi:MAG TPA: UDP-N-acetylmuramoyl-L-alanine--D-glutamate ligase [Gemmatimonadaceae bacterium]|nr:UDP-N-acetylmuramoyl-L-alanine--D-glutamate ligase [Gemmatimonadaceae bacterium]
MIEELLRKGEVAVLGLGKSGRAAAQLLVKNRARVYASDAGSKREALEGATALSSHGIDAQTGGHDLDRIAKASLVVVSPGIPPSAPPLLAARSAGVPIISEIELALAFLPNARIIAITGTNGKTTTTALIGHLLTSLGCDAATAGNIGTPLATFALRAKPPVWFALEVSSFQLHDTPSLAPRVGVLTNLTPDHLDRYASAEEYYADKARLFANASASSEWVWNGDSDRVRAMASPVAGHHSTFALEANADAWFDRKANQLMVAGSSLIQREEFGLLGDHNVANALAASLAVMVGDAVHRTPHARSRIAAGLRSFRALAHRLEVVGEFNGVEWINDSKATNVDSARVAVAGMRRPTILLLGGRHKGEPYTSLAADIRSHVKTVLAYGEAAALVEADLSGVVPVERLGSSFETVISRARALAAPGDAVLLSPACSSYDMFDNYEMRGAEFRRLAASQ